MRRSKRRWRIVNIFGEYVTVAFKLSFVFDGRIANPKRKINAYLKPTEGVVATAICRSMLHWDITMLHWDITVLHSDITMLHWDITVLHSNITKLHWDIAMLHWDITVLHSDITMLCISCFIMWLFLFLILYLIGNNGINEKNFPFLAKLLNSDSRFSLPLLLLYLLLLFLKKTVLLPSKL